MNILFLKPSLKIRIFFPVRNFLKFKFYLIAFVVLLFSCEKVKNPNEAFQKKYGLEVERMRLSRQPLQQAQQEVMNSYPPSKEEVEEYLSKSSEYQPYVDIAQIGQNVLRQHLPNQETYEQNSKNNPSNKLPPNIFELAYNINPYPPFQSNGSEFDEIFIPDFDSYRVPTAMLDKSYLLAGIDSVQKSIDQINTQRTASEIDISQTLIEEKKQLKRKMNAEKFLDEESLIEERQSEKNGKKQVAKKLKKPVTPKKEISDLKNGNKVEASKDSSLKPASKPL